MDSDKNLYCPICGCEYREGFSVCKDCNVELVNEKPIKETEEPPSQDWVKLLDNIGDIEADMVISLLSYYDIQAKKFYKGETQYISLFMGALGSGVYVIVKSSELEASKKILDAEIDINKLYE